MKTFAEISTSKTLPTLDQGSREEKSLLRPDICGAQLPPAGAILGLDQGTVSAVHVGWLTFVGLWRPGGVVGEGIMRHSDPGRPPTFFLVISQSAHRHTG